MSYASHWQCTQCKKKYAFDHLMNLCPDDGRPVEVIIDTDKIKQSFADKPWLQADIKSMWRYGPLLALDINNAEDRQSIITFNEGFTPELPIYHHPLVEKYGFKLFLKDEGQPHPGYGANPTGSFKDRGMSMAISMAKHYGIKKVVVPTQGNAGDSLTEYAIKAGMEAVVIMPEDTPMPILGKVSALAHMNPQITLELVTGTIKEAGALMKERYLPQGYFNMATFQEPGWRIEGKKTLGYELAEPQDASQNEWQLPDVIVYPTGGGTGILGMWKAFDELQALGLIDHKRPRIISVQSNATAPLVNAYEKGDSDTQVVSAGNTLATGLNVPGGVGHFKVLEIIRQSSGGAFAVKEEAIAEQLRHIYHNYGIWICPEGAATMAALEPAFQDGLIKRGDKVVVVNTGSFEKYLPNVRDLIFT